MKPANHGLSPQSSKKLSVASETTDIAFRQKMEEIAISEKEQITEKKANALGYPFINLVHFPLREEALTYLKKTEAQETQAICFLNLGNQIRIGAVDPGIPALQAVIQRLQEAKPKLSIQIYLISQNSFQHALRLYDLLPAPILTSAGLSISAEEFQHAQRAFTDLPSFVKKLKEIDTTEIVSFIIATGLQVKASDIHIESEENTVRVRYRMDGILQDIAQLPGEMWKKINSRVKLLSGLKINVTTRPQDGRFTIHLPNDRIDVRVATLPSQFGESIVLRLLQASSIGLALKNLGVEDSALTSLLREIQRPNGMIITTGPTGAGKTTTLYAIVNELNHPGIKIITIEDPIEYQLAGITQSQVEEKKQYTFASGLKSILRQDPDVILVGEIRDEDTVDMAIQAALTGHLVLSTLHTNSASGAIPRFLSLGAKPFLLAPSLNAIIAQRLARRLCEKCKQPTKITQEDSKRVQEQLAHLTPKALEKFQTLYDPSKLQFYSASGCQACHNLGYLGRIGIYEIFTMSPEIEKLILSGHVSEYDMQILAIKQGMVTMAQDGILKALQGITSLEEVFRVAE